MKMGEFVESEGEFLKLVEAHKLRDQAREIMEEIGLDHHEHYEHRGHHRHK